MTVTIATLRAAGLSAEQIVRVLETEENERIARRREQNRINKKNQRSRQQNSDDRADRADTPSSPASPPSMVSPITPSLTTPSSSPPSDSRAVAVATRPADPFEVFWKAYPKRDGANPKAPALKKFVAHVKSGVEAEAIIVGARAYARAESDKGNVGTAYIAQAMTWLNQRRWEDYAAPIATDTPQANGWRPGLPTSEELRAKYAERRKAENAATTGTDLLAKSPGVCGENGHGLVRDQAGDGGVRQLGRTFPQGGMEAVGDEATRARSSGNLPGAGAMAGMVRDSTDTDGIPPFLRRTA